VVDFLTHFETKITSHIYHRSILARLRGADKEYKRNRRHGILDADVDFGENFKIVSDWCVPVRVDGRGTKEAPGMLPPTASCIMLCVCA